MSFNLWFNFSTVLFITVLLFFFNLIDYRCRCNADSNRCLQTVLEGKNPHKKDNQCYSNKQCYSNNVTGIDNETLIEN